MKFIQILILWTMSFVISLCHPLPGTRRGQVHHRIHVPTKVRTVYRTKIIKVPEYHHYIHEKGKKEVYYDRIKEVPHHHHEELHNDYPNFDYGHDYGHENLQRRYRPIKRYQVI